MGTDMDDATRTELEAAAFHGLGEQVRAGVSNNLEAFSILAGDDANDRVLFNLKRRIDQLAVDFSAEGRLGKPRANVRRDLGHGDWRRIFACAAVW